MSVPTYVDVRVTMKQDTWAFGEIEGSPATGTGSGSGGKPN